MSQLTSNTIFGKFFRLRRLSVGLTQAQLAEICHCAKSEISKIELGRKHAPHGVIEKADRATGDDGDLILMYNELPWEDLKEGFQQYLRHEERATSIRDYQPTIIPGILQTPDYARALIRGAQPDAKPDVVNDLISDRMDRQKIFEHEDSPALVVILDESTVRRSLGGPEIFRGQLDSLIGAAQRPEVTLRVIPASIQVRPGLVSGFTLLDFVERPTVAYSEDLVTGRLTDDPSRVARYVTEFDAVRACSMHVEASLELIKQIREET